MSKTKADKQWLDDVSDGSEKDGIEWRPIPDWVGFYEVSNDGRIRSVRRLVSINSVTPERKRWMGGTERTLSRWKDGYLGVTLTGGGLRSRMAVHRAVLLAFKGQPGIGNVCRHLNGNPSDNRLDNLEWGSHLDNMQDRKGHGRYSSGEQHHMSKLTAEQVVSIYKSRGTAADVAAAYGVNQSLIHKIRCGELWREVTGGVPNGVRVTYGKRKTDKLNIEKADEMRALHKAGESIKFLAEKFGVSCQTVRGVCTGKTWISPELHKNTIGRAA